MKDRPRSSDGPDYRHTRVLWIKRKDICDREGDVYLTRWHLLEFFGKALMLHHMHRPDQDRCHHDHPWWFVTLVLKGGYEEEVVRVHRSWLDNDTRFVDSRWNRPGTVLYRPAKHTHRVSRLPNGSCWTLVLRGDYTRRWGFWNQWGEWKPWTDFIGWAGTVLWCGRTSDLDTTKGGQP